MADVHVKVVNSAGQTATLLLDEDAELIKTLRARQERGDYKSVTVTRPRGPKKASGHGQLGDAG